SRRRRRMWRRRSTPSRRPRRGGCSRSRTGGRSCRTAAPGPPGEQSFRGRARVDLTVEDLVEESPERRVLLEALSEVGGEPGGGPVDDLPREATALGRAAGVRLVEEPL